MIEQPDEHPAPPAPLPLIDALRLHVSDGNWTEAFRFVDAIERESGESKTAECPKFQLLAGQVALGRERYREARHRFRKAFNKEETDVEARYYMGRTWLVAGRLDLAVEQFAKVALNADALTPWRVHSLSGLSVAYTGLEREQSAAKAMQNAVSFGIGSGQLLADEARRLTLSGDLESARSHLARALQSDLGCVDAFYQFANLLYVHGAIDDATNLLDHGIDQNPAAINLWALLGEIHFSLGEYPEAAAVYYRCVEMSPHGANAPEYRMNFARAMYRNGKEAVAIKALQDLLDEHPRSGLRKEARSRLNALSSGASRSGLLEPFPRMLQKRNYCAPNTLANILQYFGYTLEQDDIAEQVFTDGTRWPDMLDFLETLEGFTSFAFLSDLDQIKKLIDAKIPLVVGEYEGTSGHAIAIIGYDDQMGVVIAQDPLYLQPVELTYEEFEKSWEFTDNLVVVVVPDKRADQVEKLGLKDQDIVEDWIRAQQLSSKGKFDKSEEILSDLMESHPDYRAASRSAAELALMMGNYQGVLDICREQLERKANVYWALRYGGDAALQLGELTTTWDYYSRAVRIYPDDPMLRYLRGELSYAAGDKKRARAELTIALDREPSHLPSRLRLAGDYYESGDYQKASYHCDAVLELSPGQRDATILKSKIDEAIAADEEALAVDVEYEE